MRAYALLAAVAAALALAGDASAQAPAGQGGSNGGNLPSYAGRVGGLTNNLHWTSKITGWLPSFRSAPPRQGSMNMSQIPDPDAAGRQYLSAFGFRRYR